MTLLASTIFDGLMIWASVKVYRQVPKILASTKK